MDGLIAHCTPWNVSQSVLEPFAFTAEKQRVIHGMIEERVMQLIEEHVGIRLFDRETCLLTMKSSLSVQFASLLVDTGLGEIIDAWKTRQGNVSGHSLYFIPGFMTSTADHTFDPICHTCAKNIILNIN